MWRKSHFPLVRHPINHEHNSFTYRIQSFFRHKWLISVCASGLPYLLWGFITNFWNVSIHSSSKVIKKQYQQFDKSMKEDQPRDHDTMEKSYMSRETFLLAFLFLLLVIIIEIVIVLGKLDLIYMFKPSSKYSEWASNSAWINMEQELGTFLKVDKIMSQSYHPFVSAKSVKFLNDKICGNFA